MNLETAMAQALARKEKTASYAKGLGALGALLGGAGGAAAGAKAGAKGAAKLQAHIAKNPPKLTGNKLLDSIKEKALRLDLNAGEKAGKIGGGVVGGTAGAGLGGAAGAALGKAIDKRRAAKALASGKWSKLSKEQKAGLAAGGVGLAGLGALVASK